MHICVQSIETVCAVCNLYKLCAVWNPANGPDSTQRFHIRQFYIFKMKQSHRSGCDVLVTVNKF